MRHACGDYSERYGVWMNFPTVMLPGGRTVCHTVTRQDPPLPIREWKNASMNGGSHVGHEVGPVNGRMRL